MQVASHAQKYYLRQNLGPARRQKKRPSIHDICRPIDEMDTAFCAEPKDLNRANLGLGGISDHGDPKVTTPDGNFSDTNDSFSAGVKVETSMFAWNLYP